MIRVRAAKRKFWDQKMYCGRRGAIWNGCTMLQSCRHLKTGSICTLQCILAQERKAGCSDRLIAPHYIRSARNAQWKEFSFLKDRISPSSSPTSSMCSIFNDSHGQDPSSHKLSFTCPHRMIGKRLEEQLKIREVWLKAAENRLKFSTWTNTGWPGLRKMI